MSRRPFAPPAEPDSASVDVIEQVIRTLLTHLHPDEREGKPGRPRILPAAALWGGVLVGILRGMRSQLEIWRLLSELRLWDYPRFPVSDQAVYRRLATAGTAPLEQLFAATSTVLQARLAPYVAEDLAPFARDVVVLDETTLDRVARTLPVLREVPAGDDRMMPGKLAGVYDVRRQLWRHVTYLPDPHQNEKVAARDLAATLAPHSLILADLGYFGFAWFDDLTDAGHFWISRERTRSSYTVVATLYAQGETRDELVWLGAYRSDRAKHLVRRVQFRVNGTRSCYLTNVRDPERLSIAEIARCYARRWDIELAIKLAKRELGLHLFWSAKPTVVLQQVWGVLIIAQILHALRLEIAGRAGVDPFDVSLPLLVRYLPRWAAQGEDPIEQAVRRGTGMGVIRPSRRIVIQAPTPPLAAYTQPPPDLVVERTPRYARRNCGPRLVAYGCI
ncbi:MAG TPA: IS4 family transposase [Nitrolancea sp.]|jgi:hypothetical protein|nr:IS4 family transposase [Nitrolancea sp.]